MLTTRTPQLSEGLVIWSHKDAAFVPRVVPTTGAVIVDVPSTCLHIDSAEVRAQVSYLGAAGRITLADTLNAAARALPKVVKKESRKSGGGEDEEDEEEGEGDGDGEGGDGGEGGEGGEAAEERAASISESAGAGDAPPGER